LGPTANVKEAELVVTMAMAMRSSVTVSMGELTKGSESLILRVTRVSRLTSSTPKSMWLGSTIKSLKVSPCEPLAEKSSAAEWPSSNDDSST